MQVTITSTDRIVYINDEPCRVWEGRTAGGVSMTAFVRTVAVDRHEDVAEFDRDLQEHAPPRSSAPEHTWPLRMVL